MKVLICALNTKYVHSSLAPWCLAAGIEQYAKGVEWEIYESTVNEDYDTVLDAIMQYDFDLIGFCTYIWNIERVLSLSKRIK